MSLVGRGGGRFDLDHLLKVAPLSLLSAGLDALGCFLFIYMNNMDNVLEQTAYAPCSNSRALARVLLVIVSPPRSLASSWIRSSLSSGCIEVSV